MFVDATYINDSNNETRIVSDMSGVLGIVLLASCTSVQVYVCIDHANHVICATSAVPNARFVICVTPFRFVNYNEYRKSLIWSADLLSYCFVAHHHDTCANELHNN